MSRALDRFAVVAAVAWIAGAAVARHHGLWLGVGVVSVPLGVVALAFDGIGLRGRLRPTVARIALGVAVGAAMAAATWLLYPVCLAIAPASAAETQRLYAMFAALPGPMATLLLLPIIVGEELVWRGAVHGAIARRAGAVTTVVAAAALYAAAHAPVGSVLLVVVAFGCGVVWGILRAATGDLVAPLAAHLVWDLYVLVVHPVAG